VFADLQFKIVMSQKQQQQTDGAMGNPSAGSRRSIGKMEKGESTSDLPMSSTYFVY